MPDEPPKENRIAGLCALIDAMTSLWPPVVIDPSPPDLQGNPAQLAIDSAKSATAIAHAVAQLGQGDDQSQAKILWNETLNQMARVQAQMKVMQSLNNFPQTVSPFPFQSQPLPPGAS